MPWQKECGPVIFASAVPELCHDMIAPITGIAVFGELPIIFWLLIKGVKAGKDKGVVKFA